MSNPALPRSETPPLPTRRQLDELDALLQRMLELPVDHSAEADLADADPSEAAGPPFTETSAWTSRWVETAESSQPDPVPVAPAPAESPSDWHSRWAPPAEDAPTMPDSTRLEFPPLPREMLRPEQANSDPQSWEKFVSGSATAASDESSDEFAAPTRLRIHPPTLQVVLGWLGLMCLLASLALLAYDWFGWTW